MASLVQNLANWRRRTNPVREVFAIFLAPLLGFLSAYWMFHAMGIAQWHHAVTGLSAQLSTLVLLGASYIYPPMLFVAAPIYFLLKFKTKLPFLPLALLSGAIIGALWGGIVGGGFVKLQSALMLPASVAGILVASWFWLIVALPFKQN